MMRAAVKVIALSVLVLTMTGCAMQQLPTYDVVRSETTAAMQQVVDQLPADSVVDDRTDPTPYGCDGGGVLFTGHWEVQVPDGFDTRAFIEELPGRVAENFVKEERGVPHSYPLISLRTKGDSEVSLDVSNRDPENLPKINILALSRCAQAPSTSSQ